MQEVEYREVGMAFAVEFDRKFQNICRGVNSLVSSGAITAEEAEVHKITQYAQLMTTLSRDERHSVEAFNNLPLGVQEELCNKYAVSVEDQPEPVQLRRD